MIQSFSGFDGIKAGLSILDLIAFSAENRCPLFRKML